MSFWSAMVFIAVIAALVYLRLEKYRAIGRRGDEGRSAGASRIELELEVADLKRRLEVMERIVTDERRSRAVADEIEALRDR